MLAMPYFLEPIVLGACEYHHISAQLYSYNSVYL